MKDTQRKSSAPLSLEKLNTSRKNAAKEAFNQLDKAAAENRDPRWQGKNRIPTIKQLNQEYAEVLSGKKKAYSDYRAARKEMQDYLIARKNIEAILGMDQKQEEQEKEKLQEQQKNQNR